MKAMCPGRTLLVAMVALVASMACNGNITSGSSEGSQGNIGGTGPIIGDSCQDGSAPLLRRRIWRLSAKQYANTVADIFGVTVDATAFPADGVTNDGVTSFDTNADANPVSDVLGSLYKAKSHDIGRAMVTRLSSDKSCLLATTADEACARQTLNEWATRAFRRPIDDGESDRLLEFYTSARKAHGEATATRMVFEALSQSPWFLYRTELGAKDEAEQVELTQHEIASQLSYFLADRPPDDLLLQAAQRQELADAEGRKPHVERLLALPSAREKLGDFFVSYFGLKKLIEGSTKDAQMFPMFDEDLQKALVADARAAIERSIFDGPGTLEGLLTGNLPLGSPLGATYGTAERPGIITHPAVLAALSNEATTSPVHRGLFFWQTLLCNTLPAPPADAANSPALLTDPNNPDGSEREQWAYFQQQEPACAGCHALFHPVGLALENYDPIGRQRESRDLDLSVTLDGVSKELDGYHEDGVALANAIAGSTLGRACLALQLSAFGFGRSVDDGDNGCYLHQTATRFAGRNLDIKALLTALTEDQSFVQRRNHADDGGQ